MESLVYYGRQNQKLRKQIVIVFVVKCLQNYAVYCVNLLAFFGFVLLFSNLKSDVNLAQSVVDV